MQTAELFDQNARHHGTDLARDRYSAHFKRMNSEDLRPAFSGYEANVRRFLPASERARILDYGCGFGQFLRYLRSLQFECVEGIDISANQLEYCRRVGLDNALFTPDPLRFLSERKVTYDFVGSFDVIEHIPKLLVLPTLAAIYESLRPGGTFVMRVPNIAAPVGAWELFRDFTHECIYAEDSALQVLELAAFTEIQVLAEKNMYRRKLLGLCLECARHVLYTTTKFIYWLQCPGSVIPSIFTGNLYAIGHKPSS